MYICIYVYTHTHTYIYIYNTGEREEDNGGGKEEKQNIIKIIKGRQHLSRRALLTSKSISLPFAFVTCSHNLPYCTVWYITVRYTQVSAASDTFAATNMNIRLGVKNNPLFK
jgi:hypothetical protein